MQRSDTLEAGRLERLLRRHGLYAAKGLGQHFLADENVLRGVAEAANPGPDSQVVEIGSGVGNLTHFLSLSGAQVTGIELDRKFELLHRELFTTRPEGAGPVEIVYADALEFDYKAASARAADAGKRFVIVGNIPYQITTPLIMGILESGVPFESMILMMQREVAERLAAEPGTRKNGSISIKVQYFCDVEDVLDVPPEAFLPPPEVHSRVVRFVQREPAEKVQNRDEFFKLVDAAFAQRRKMLPNSVAARNVGFSREQVEKALAHIGLSPSVRAEQLGVFEFVRLFNSLTG